MTAPAEVSKKRSNFRISLFNIATNLTLKRLVYGTKMIGEEW